MAAREQGVVRRPAAARDLQLRVLRDDRLRPRRAGRHVFDRFAPHTGAGAEASGAATIARLSSVPFSGMSTRQAGSASGTASAVSASRAPAGARGQHRPGPRAAAPRLRRQRPPRQGVRPRRWPGRRGRPARTGRGSPTAPHAADPTPWPRPDRRCPPRPARRRHRGSPPAAGSRRTAPRRATPAPVPASDARRCARSRRHPVDRIADREDQGRHGRAGPHGPHEVRKIFIRRPSTQRGSQLGLIAEDHRSAADPRFPDDIDRGPVDVEQRVLPSLCAATSRSGPRTAGPGSRPRRPQPPPGRQPEAPPHPAPTETAAPADEWPRQHAEQLPSRRTE